MTIFKRGDLVISKIVPTITYVVSEVHEDHCILVHTTRMINPEDWALLAIKD